MAAIHPDIIDYSDTVDIEAEIIKEGQDYKKVLESLNRTLSTSQQKYINKIFHFIRTNRGDIANAITQQYRENSDKFMYPFDIREIAVDDYMGEMDKLYNKTFECLDRVTNTREAKDFLFNLLGAIYSILYPNTLLFFQGFVKKVAKYIKSKQAGYICIFDGETEKLQEDFFEHVVVGSLLAFGIQLAEYCIRLNTLRFAISRDKTVAWKQPKKPAICEIFNTNAITPRTFKRELMAKLKKKSGAASGAGSGGRRRKRHTRKNKKRKKTRKQARKQKRTKRVKRTRRAKRN